MKAYREFSSAMILKTCDKFLKFVADAPADAIALYSANDVDKVRVLKMMSSVYSYKGFISLDDEYISLLYDYMDNSHNEF